MSHKLRGVAWNHPRGLDSLRAASIGLASGTGVLIEWDGRSLESFEDTPVAELSSEYDLIALDHPHLGDAVAAGALVPLGRLPANDPPDGLRNSFVGPSWESYLLEETIWAAPIDAACQVSAARLDLLPNTLPTSWSEVSELSRSVGRDRLAIAANPTHLLCVLLSLCDEQARLSRPRGGSQPTWWDAEEGIETRVLRASIGSLLELLSLCAPESVSLDPIQLLETMSVSDRYLYSPLVFGYITYARAHSSASIISFSDPPTQISPGGSIAGGVGLAVSAESKQRELAVEVVSLLASDDVQRGAFAAAGGQPASLSAWSDAALDYEANGFFSQTMETMTHAFLRPSLPGYPAWQAQAGRALHDLVAEGAGVESIATAINRAWESCVVNVRSAERSS